MENQIVCPNCKKTISNDPTLDAAANSSGTATQSITCECGERITYWQIMAQLRDHKAIGWRFRNWMHELSHSRK